MTTHPRALCQWDCAMEHPYQAFSHKAISLLPLLNLSSFPSYDQPVPPETDMHVLFGQALWQHKSCYYRSPIR